MTEFLLVWAGVTLVNAILIVGMAYLAVRMNLLPGVEWYWPFRRRMEEPEVSSNTVVRFLPEDSIMILDIMQSTSGLGDLLPGRLSEKESSTLLIVGLEEEKPQSGSSADYRYDQGMVAA